MNNKNKKVLLVIIDGFGVAQNWGGNAVTVAKMPFWNSLVKSAPYTKLKANGSAVGLPGHEIGNSEVGHLTIGAGRVIPQDSLRINKAIEDGSFFKNSAILRALRYSKDENLPIHFVGLLSDAAVHAYYKHLIALIDMAILHRAKKVYLHLFTDGRDMPEREGVELISRLEMHIKTQLRRVEKAVHGKDSGGDSSITIATISGRYYAMDRDRHYDRTKRTLDCLIRGKGRTADSAIGAVSRAYREGKTDQYIEPTNIVKKNGEKVGLIKDGDPLIFFNFRSDRARQITQGFMRELPNSLLVTFIPYGVSDDYHLAREPIPAFLPLAVKNNLSQYLSTAGLSQFHIAETEKYAHVTYFFNSGTEEPYLGEDRMLIPSPKVRTYNLMPQMSLNLLAKAVVAKLKKNRYQFMVANIANADMVAHTGDFHAAVEALYYIDHYLRYIVKTALSYGWQAIITSDHGNIEQMVNPADGSPDPEHTRNPVPFVIVQDNSGNLHEIRRLEKGRSLIDVAPTVLDMLELKKPPEMTGSTLIVR